MRSSRPAKALSAREAFEHLSDVLRAQRTRRQLAAKLRQERLLLRASALSYESLVAFVPMLAVSMASVGIFGGQQSLARMFRDLALFYVPYSAAEAVNRLIDMVETLDFHAVGAFGLLALLPVVFALLDAVELALSDVFGLPRQTHWWRISLLALLLSCAPLAAALSVRYADLGALPAARWLLPIGLLTALLYLVFRRMPRTRVSRRAAAVGALSATLILTLAKLAFGVYAHLAVSLHALWGAIVFVPLFLIWVLLSWYALLFASAVAAVLHRELTRLDEHRVVRPRRRGSRLRRRLRLQGRLPPPAPRLDSLP